MADALRPTVDAVPPAKWTGAGIQRCFAGNEDGERRQVATRGQGYAFIYTPYGDTIVIREERIPWTDWHCRWYDVRTGAFVAVRRTAGGPSRALSATGQSVPGK